MDTMDVYVKRSLGYVSRLEVARACREGKVVNLRDGKERACGVGTKEKNKDNGCTGVRSTGDLWEFASMLVRLRVLGGKNREGGLSGVV